MQNKMQHNAQLSRQRSGSLTATSKVQSRSSPTIELSDFPRPKLAETASYWSEWLLTFVVGGSLYRRELYCRAANITHERTKHWFMANKAWFAENSHICGDYLNHLQDPNLKTTPPAIPDRAQLKDPLVQLFFVLSKYNDSVNLNAFMPSVFVGMQRLTEFETKNLDSKGTSLFPGILDRDVKGGIQELWSYLNDRNHKVSPLVQEYLLRELKSQSTLPSSSQVTQWIKGAHLNIANKLSTPLCKITDRDIRVYNYYGLSLTQIERHYKGLTALEISLLMNTGISRKALDALKALPNYLPNYARVECHLRTWLAAIMLDPCIDLLYGLLFADMVELDIVKLLVVKIAIGNLFLQSMEWACAFYANRFNNLQSVKPTLLLYVMYQKAAMSIYDGTAANSLKTGVNFAVRGPALSSGVGWAVEDLVSPSLKSILTRACKRLTCVPHKLSESINWKDGTRPPSLPPQAFAQCLSWLQALAIVSSFEGILMYHIKGYAKDTFQSLAEGFSYVVPSREAYFASIIVRDMFGDFIDNPLNLRSLLTLVMLYCIFMPL